MHESQYQARLIKRLRELFPGCFILKNDPSYMQGVPDIILLYGTRWAMLEIKIGNRAPVQPNQEYYLHLLDKMSYASFISPDNEEDVLYDLQLTFGLLGPSRVSQPQ